MLQYISKLMRGPAKRIVKPADFDDRYQAEEYIRGLASRTTAPNAEMKQMWQEYLAIKADRNAPQGNDRSEESLARPL